MKNKALRYRTRMAFCGKWRLMTLAGLSAVLGNAQEVQDAPPLKEHRFEWQGNATFRLEGHIYDGGFDDGKPEFINRYAPLRS